MLSRAERHTCVVSCWGLEVCSSSLTSRKRFTFAVPFTFPTSSRSSLRKRQGRSYSLGSFHCWIMRSTFFIRTDGPHSNRGWSAKTLTWRTIGARPDGKQGFCSDGVFHGPSTVCSHSSWRIDSVSAIVSATIGGLQRQHAGGALYVCAIAWGQRQDHISSCELNGRDTADFRILIRNQSTPLCFFTLGDQRVVLIDFPTFAMPNAVSEKRPTSRDVIELDASWMRHALVD